MGHLGIALGAKGVRSELSLLLLCLAATLPDLIDFPLMGSGYPNAGGLWTHSVVAMIVYGIIFALVYCAVTRRILFGLMLGAVASSHVLADLLTSHMILWSGGRAVGLHLYIHPRIDLLLEGSVIVAGWWLYTRSLTQRRRFAPASLGILFILLAFQGWMETLHIS